MEGPDKGPENKPVKKSNWARALTDALSLGTTVVAVTAAGYFGGMWLDGKLGTTYLSLVGLIIGVATGLNAMYKQINKK